MELPFNRIRIILLQLSVFILLNSGQICGSEEIQPATVIAFGSCNRQNKPQDHWNIISQDLLPLLCSNDLEVCSDDYMIQRR